MRSVGRTALLGAVVWTTVVAVAGSVTFAVLDLADHVVGSPTARLADAPPAPSGAATRSGAAAPSSDVRTPTARPSATPSPDASPERTPSGTAGTTHPPSPSVTPTASPRVRPSPRPSPRSASPRPKPRTADPGPTRKAPASAPEAGSPKDKAFPTDGGTVTASCLRGAISVDSVTARDGWGFAKHVDQRRARAVVTFSRGADHAVVVLAVQCVDGAPERVQLWDRGGHDDGSGHRTHRPRGSATPEH